MTHTRKPSNHNDDTCASELKSVLDGSSHKTYGAMHDSKLGTSSYHGDAGFIARALNSQLGFYQPRKLAILTGTSNPTQRYRKP